ncbi:MAG TPA: hypothetical protein VJT78_02960, partial [Candidatus Dormibacteraeota bacterium]|nr:hypothetical protein [Candidatus Dormibacteraeota bacterium]
RPRLGMASCAGPGGRLFAPAVAAVPVRHHDRRRAQAAAELVVALSEGVDGALATARKAGLRNAEASLLERVLELALASFASCSRASKHCPLGAVLSAHGGTCMAGARCCVCCR